MKKVFLIMALVWGSFSVNAQSWQKVAGYWEYKNLRIDGAGMFRPPLSPFVGADKGSFYFRESDSTFLYWSGSAYRKISSSPDTFGLQDNIGIRDRYMNMQGRQFTIDSATDINFTGTNGGMSGQLTLNNAARLFSYDNVNVHSLYVQPNYIGIIGPALNDPAKIWIPSSDSLHTQSPKSFVVMQNDTLKVVPVADVSGIIGGGGGNQNLQQVLNNGNTSTIAIESAADISGDSSLFYNFRFRGNGQIGDTVLGSLQPYYVWGSSISTGFNASYAYGTKMQEYLQITTTINAIAGTGISSLTGANNLYSRILTFPNYTANSYMWSVDAGVNDQPADSNTYKTDFSEIIDTLHSRNGWPTSKILIISPPYSPARLGDSVFVGINQEVAAAHGAVTLDIFHPMQYAYTHGRTDLIHSDSIHMTDKGQEFIAHLVADATRNGYYRGNLVIYGSDTTRGNSTVYGDRTTYGKTIPYGAFFQPKINGSINIMQPNLSAYGQYVDLKFIPNPANSVTDSFSLRFIAQPANASDFGLFHIVGSTHTPVWQSKGADMLIGTTTPQSGYNCVVGTALYTPYATVVNGFDVGGDANAIAHRWNVYKNGNLRGSIGFSGVDGMRIGSSYGGVSLGSISSSDGTTYTPILSVTQGTGLIKINNLTNPPASYNVLVHSMSDSGTYQMPVSSIAPTIYKASATWDPASTGANSSTTTNVTVTGAALGDGVVISKASGSYSNGEVYFGYVSAPNTVTIQLQNTSGGTVDISSATFNVIVIKF